MDLYYHRSPLGNFGDDLNLWIWDELLPGWRDWDPERVLVGVGTLLSSDFTAHEDGRKRRYLVAGTGVGYGNGCAPDIADRTRWDVRSVRGPMSARSLGLPTDLGILDPAVMIGTLPAHQTSQSTGRPLFVPHESSVERHDWTAACAEIGLDYASPRGEAREVIAQIASASSVLAESMHAAILADAFRVPWTPVRIGHKFFPKKWLDWAASLDIDLQEIPPMFPFEERAFAIPQNVLASFRAYRRIKSPAPGPLGRPDRDPGAKPGAVVRLRIEMEAAHLLPALRSQLRRRTYLSGDRKLAMQVDRYRTVLDGIGNDYG